MQKRLELCADDINHARDKSFVNFVYESLIDIILSNSESSDLDFCKNAKSFKISFNLRVSKEGDLLWMLCKEFMSLIKQTEEKVQLQINEIEEDGDGTTYKIFKYIPKE